MCPGLVSSLFSMKYMQIRSVLSNLYTGRNPFKGLYVVKTETFNIEKLIAIMYVMRSFFVVTRGVAEQCDRHMSNVLRW